MIDLSQPLCTMRCRLLEGYSFSIKAAKRFLDVVAWSIRVFQVELFVGLVGDF